MAGSVVEVVGVDRTRALMARFQPDLLKRLDSTLNVVARDLKAGAQSNLARTGMTGSAYRVRTRTRAYGFSKGVTTVPGSVGPHEKWSSEPGVLARIFELAAGVRNARPENVKRTRSLIDTLNARYGSPGRFLWEAWDAKKDSYMGAVGSEIKAVEAEYTARMT